MRLGPRAAGSAEPSLYRGRLRPAEESELSLSVGYACREVPRPHMVTSTLTVVSRLPVQAPRVQPVLPLWPGYTLRTC